MLGQFSTKRTGKNMDISMPIMEDLSRRRTCFFHLLIAFFKTLDDEQRQSIYKKKC